MIHSANSFVVDETLAEDELLCEICCDLIDPEGLNNSNLKESRSNSYEQADYQLSCGHNFCSKCWKDYLHNKVKSSNENERVCVYYLKL